MEELQLLDSVEEQLQHLRNVRDQFEKAQEIDLLIANSVHDADTLLEYTRRKIERLKRVQAIESSDEGPEWSCTDSTCTGLFYRLQEIPDDEPFVEEIDDEGRPRWAGAVTELAYLCKCLRDAGLIRGLGSKGDFENFVSREFATDSTSGTLKTTWTTSPQPDADLEAHFTQQQKVERFRMLREIAEGFASE